jgi:act minimal PKS acyl carrier protein
MSELTLPALLRMLKECAGADENVDLEQDLIDTPFEQLGYDSIALLEVLGHIERELGVRVPDDAAQSETPRQMLAEVNAASGSAA